MWKLDLFQQYKTVDHVKVEQFMQESKVSYSSKVEICRALRNLDGRYIQVVGDHGNLRCQCLQGGMAAKQLKRVPGEELVE